MKERPILFNAEMVRAILDGRKTQTRRPFKRARNIITLSTGNVTEWAGAVLPAREAGYIAWYPGAQDADEMAELTKLAYKTGFLCPIGQPGDRLWVRETWAAIWPEWCDNGMVYDDEHLSGRPIQDKERVIEYRANLPLGSDDYPGLWPAEEARGNPDAPKWRPSIHMPRWAARILLEITAVRVERVQDIRIGDLCAEGILPDERYLGGANRLRHPFMELWDSLYAKSGYGWESNPWVWVVEFKQHIEA